jgi:asparagine synthase (glutamine-hydrolysing)
MNTFAIRLGAAEDIPLAVLRNNNVEVTSGGGWAIYTRGELPVRVGDGGDLVCFAGHLSNRHALESHTAWASSSTDAEIFAAAYDGQRSHTLRQILGEFSFARVDTRTERLVAGNDAIGVGKLVYFKDAANVWVASSLEFLMSLAPQLASIDHDGATYFIASGGCLGPSGHTLFRGIRYLPGGHTVAASVSEKLTIGRYWIPDFERQTECGDPREYDEQFRQLLGDAVHQALRSKDVASVELSGGLDSSTVTAVAAQLHQAGKCGAADLVAYSMVAPGSPPADERAFQEAVLRMYPVEHYGFDMDEAARTATPRMSMQPSLMDCQVWIAQTHQTLSAMRRPAICLTGQGGDAVLGYAMPPFELTDSLRALQLRQWMRDLRKWADTGRYSLWKLMWTFSRGDIHGGAGRTVAAPNWMSSRLAGEIGAAQRAAISGFCGRYARSSREFQYQLVLTSAAALPDPTQSPWQPRYPLLSRPLVEFMLSLPSALKWSPHANRILQRRALRDVLPREVARRITKADFTPLFFKNLRSRWDFWGPLTAGTHLADLGLVDAAAFRRAGERLRHGFAADHLHYMCSALLLEAWLTHRNLPKAA